VPAREGRPGAPTTYVGQGADDSDPMEPLHIPVLAHEQSPCAAQATPYGDRRGGTLWRFELDAFGDPCSASRGGRALPPAPSAGAVLITRCQPTRAEREAEEPERSEVRMHLT